MTTTNDTYHILFYDYVEDYLERREAHRDAHLALLFAERDAGRVLMAGTLGDPPRRAALVFKGVERSHIEKFVSADPYVALGLVSKWQIQLYRNVL
jgi:uncharacterized protein YciI